MINKLSRVVFLNTFLITALIYLGLQGVLTTLYKNDILYIVTCISFLTAFGLMMIPYKKIVSDYVADTVVGLGLLGTLYGVYIAFSSFSSADFSNVENLTKVLEGLLGGLSAAIWTTIAGLIGSIIITSNSLAWWWGQNEN